MTEGDCINNEWGGASILNGGIATMMSGGIASLMNTWTASITSGNNDRRDCVNDEWRGCIENGGMRVAARNSSVHY